jgi:hypothetical protein
LPGAGASVAFDVATGVHYVAVPDENAILAIAL